MGESWKVTSADTLLGFTNKAASLLQEHGQVRFSWRAGKDRSLDQNDMCFQLYQTIGKTLYGGDISLARNECKLTKGVPILREESESFRETYDRCLKPLSYEDKLEVMDMISISSLMTTGQCSKYITAIMNTYTLKGVNFSYLGDL